MVEVSCSSQLYPKHFDMSNPTKSQLSQCYALILGKALSQMLPKIELLDYAIDGPHFCYRLQGDQVDSIHLDEIKQHMHTLIEQNQEFYPLEMISSSLCELFRHHNQSTRAECLDPEKTYQVVKIGDYFDELKEPLTTLQKCPFTLHSVEVNDQGETCILGVLSMEQKSLKKIIKSLTQKRKNKRLNANFIQDDKGHVWISPKGIKQINNLQKNFDEALEEAGFEPTESLSATTSFSRLASSSFDQVYFKKEVAETHETPFKNRNLNAACGMQTFFFKRINQENVEKESIYCLKFYLKMIKILGFSYEASFHAKKWGAEIEKTLQACALSGAQKSQMRDALEIDLKDDLEHTVAQGSLEIKTARGKTWIEGRLPNIKGILEAFTENLDRTDLEFS